jgi:hypothetical protein
VQPKGPFAAPIVLEIPRLGHGQAPPMTTPTLMPALFIRQTSTDLNVSFPTVYWIGV